MNPFAALDISDDDEQQFTTATGTEQSPKKSKLSVITSHQSRAGQGGQDPGGREQRQAARPGNQELPERTKEDPRKKKVLRDGAPQRKSQPPATTSTEGAERAESTSPGRRAEATAASATCRTSCRREKYIKEGEETPAEGAEEQKEPESPRASRCDKLLPQQGHRLQRAGRRRSP